MKSSSAADRRGACDGVLTRAAHTGHLGGRAVGEEVGERQAHAQKGRRYRQRRKVLDDGHVHEHVGRFRR